MAASDYVGFTDSIKAQFKRDLADESKNPTKDVTVWLHRCYEWAAGTYPKGLTYSDVRWMAEQCVAELHKRNPKSTASMDGFPAASDGDEAKGPESKSANLDVEERCQAGQAALSAASKPAGRSAEPTRSPVQLKRAFASLTEQPPAHQVDLEVRMADDGEDPIAHFVGYASTTGDSYAVTDWLGEYRETIQPGAFAKTLREQGAIPLLFDHDGMPLASTQSGTSRLAEDGRGLRNEADLDRRQGLTNDLCIALRRGDINKMSFSFRAIRDDWNDAYDDRSVSELALFDTSIVTYPANPSTTADLRNAMRSALGREGVSLMFSVRSALAEAEHARIPETAEPDVEKALRALALTDEYLCRRNGPHGRARTFQIARLLGEVREGKVLSSENEEMLQHALNCLHQADDADIPSIVRSLQDIDTAVDEGQAALAEVLGKANPDGDKNDMQPALAKPAGANKTGVDKGTGSAGNPNPLLPADGAGPRSVKPTVVATRKLLEQLSRP